ncbi:MAG: FAD binding domain-containing protein, partial [Stellaceae bacterium]
VSHFMKPSRFDYRAPETLDEAVALLAADPGAKPIAGGQSLMPILAFRLATPSLLVDLRRVAGLHDIVIDDDGVRLGAKVRRRDIEQDRRPQSTHPPLRAVAHYQICNRGTVGGSLAHADPAAELPDVVVALRRRDHHPPSAYAQRVAWNGRILSSPALAEPGCD